MVKNYSTQEPNVSSHTSDVDEDAQIACSGYKDIPSALGGIDQVEEDMVQDDALIAKDHNSSVTIPCIRNPYNNMAASSALNTTPYALEDSHPIHVPDWYLNMIVSNDMLEVTGKKMKTENWMTHDLQAEIESNYPTVDEIQVDIVTGICKRNLEAFRTKCLLMFHMGQVFMSSCQLDQAAKYFLDGWNVKKLTILKNSMLLWYEQKEELCINL